MIRFLSAMLFFAMANIVPAQTGSNDPTFNTFDNGDFGNGIGFDWKINSTAIQTDGKIIVGGSFTYYNGTTINRIARLNANGSLDTTFNIGTGFNAIVRSISIQSDGKIIVGGDFTSFNGVSANRIARLNSNGEIDATFNTGTGFNAEVRSIAIQSDGKIIVGGGFFSYNGTIKSCIARLNPDGSIDLPFYPGVGFSGTSSNVYVNTISIQSDEKIIVGGSFTSFNSISRKHIARLNSDGSLDATFNPGTGFSGSSNACVNATAIQSDGKIIVGGYFTIYSYVAVDHILRINVDGSIDNSFNPGTGLGGVMSPSAQSIVIQADGNIIVGGYFTSFNGLPHNCILRLKPDGSLDTTFDPGTGATGPIGGSNGCVNSLSIQSDGKIIVGGDFGKFNGNIRSSLVRLENDGTLDVSLIQCTGFNNKVNAVAVQSDGKILVGGNFTSYNGAIITRIARLHMDGELDTTFNPGLGFDYEVRTIAIQSNGKIIVGGAFTSYNGSVASHIIRLNADGTIDTTFNQGTGFNHFVNIIVVQSDEKILVGGIFTTFNGIPSSGINRLNVDGSRDITFMPVTGLNIWVNTIAIQNDGKIIVGGSFNSFNGATRNMITRLNANGTLDPSFCNNGNGFNKEVFSVGIQADGKIIVGGKFDYYSSTSIKRISRLNNDGTLDYSFNPGTGFDGPMSPDVSSIAIQPNGRIIAIGFFNSFNGTTVNSIARLNSDGTLDLSFDPGIGFPQRPYTTAFQSDGKIIVGGSFTQFNEIWRNGIVRLIAENFTYVNVDTAHNIKVYPNPSDGMFTFITEKIGGKYKITDNIGRVICQGTIFNSQTEIDLRNNASGVYFLFIDGYAQKLIKQ